MPSVSAVIPTFGRPELLRRAIDSVLGQSFTDLEVIVVVDGDDPATMAALAAVDDARLRSIVHPAQRGAGEARNTGAKAASGEWVAFLDDDDEWLPAKIERQLAVAPAEPAVLMALSRVVTSRGTFVRPGEIYDGRMPVDEWLFDRRTWFKGGEAFLQTSSLMMPRRLFDMLEFSNSKQHEDWELVLRAVKEHGYRLVTAPEALVVFYMPEDRPSLSRTATWQHSLGWGEALGPILSRKAFSGFCLTMVAAMASAAGTREAFRPLWRAAWRQGRPTAKQIVAFAYFILFPPPVRQRIRALLQAERKSD